MKRTPLRPMSNKRRKQLIERAQVRQEVLERDGGCVFWAQAWSTDQWLPGDLVGAPVRCQGPMDVHEVVRRSQNSEAWLTPALCVVLCRAHHSFVTEHPEAAHRLGLVKWSWEA